MRGARLGRFGEKTSVKVHVTIEEDDVRIWKQLKGSLEALAQSSVLVFICKVVGVLCKVPRIQDTNKTTSGGSNVAEPGEDKVEPPFNVCSTRDIRQCCTAGAACARRTKRGWNPPSPGSRPARRTDANRSLHSLGAKTDQKWRSTRHRAQ